MRLRLGILRGPPVPAAPTTAKVRVVLLLHDFYFPHQMEPPAVGGGGAVSGPPRPVPPRPTSSAPSSGSFASLFFSYPHRRRSGLLTPPLALAAPDVFEENTLEEKPTPWNAFVQPDPRESPPLWAFNP